MYFTGDKITYLFNGVEKEGIIVQITGDKHWLDNGYIVYSKQILR